MLSLMCAGQKQQKVSEIKASLDDADVLVMYTFYFLSRNLLVFFFFPKFIM